MRERARDAAYWIDRLGLAPHPEGGYFRETYRAREAISADALPERFTGARAFSTAIYFLLTAGECSVLHRIRADELWHHYTGAALTVVTIDDGGALATHRLGRDAERGECFQLVIPGGTWFGAAITDATTTPRDPTTFALVGCTVAPGFDFADFEIGARADLVRRYPQHRAVIERLTR